MKVYRLAAMALAVTGMAWALAPAWGEDAPKWGAHLDLEGKLGTKRHLGEVDLFLPVLQDGRNLLFANIRTRMDDEGSREGNFGLGLRHMLESGWNLGGYGYFDRRRSEMDNYFNQVALGADALSLDWDVRGNVYLPMGRTTRNADSLNTAEISGASVIFRGGEERALGGFDAEIGWRVPLFEVEAGQQLRFYAGGYRFADEGVPMVAGPRGRAELVFDEVPGLWEGSRLSFGAEWQHDEPRGSQGFLTARLRIPLQSETRTSSLTAMERRMADPIVRDVDIVSQAGTFGATETATATNGGAITVINSSTVSGADLKAALASAGAGNTVVLSGTFNTTYAAVTDTVEVALNQTVMGAGDLVVRSSSGRTATLSNSTGATINATISGANNAALIMRDGSTLTGMTITAIRGGNVINVYGVNVGDISPAGGGANGVTIANNVITVSSDTLNVAAVRITNASQNVTVTGNTISATRSGAASVNSAIGLLIDDNSTATIANNSFAAYGNNTLMAVYRSDSTALAGSTGNVFVSGTCFIGNPNTGSVGYTDAGGASGTCP